MKFILLDKVTELIAGESAKGIKCVSMCNEIFDDHFPENPIYPGTLTIESMAQLGGLLAEVSLNTEKNIRRAILSQIDKAKFYTLCGPGDKITLNCQVLSTLEGAVRIQAQASVEGKRTARAELTFVMRIVNSTEVHEQRRKLYKIWTRDLQAGSPIL